MNKISRYILRSSFAPFIFGSSTVIFLFLMQFLMKTLDKLIGKGLDNIVIVQLITYNISWMLVLAVPMGILFASLVTFGNMSASYEITIIKASGGSLIKMMRPLIIVGFILFIIVFWYNDYILPETNYKLKTLTFDIQRKKPILAIESGQFSNDIEGYIILAREIDTATNMLYSVTIYDQRQININRTISAESCKLTFAEDMKHIIFKLKNGEMHQSKISDLKDYRIIRFDDYKLITTAQGFGFEQSEEGVLTRGDRELHISDMKEFVYQFKERQKDAEKQLNSIINEHIAYILGDPLPKKNNIDTTEKYIDNKDINANITNRNTKAWKNNLANFSINLINTKNNIKIAKQQINVYEVEIYKKYAIPFACFIFVLVGCPLGIMTKGGNFGINAAITLGFYILYWACLIGGEKLADRDFASPMLSMWLGNIIVGTAGVILTIKVNNEKVFVTFNKIQKKLLQRKQK